MARQVPEKLQHHPIGVGDYVERQVVDDLVQQLPDNFTVFQGGEWAVNANQADRHGEIDVVVVGPNGAVALVEVKSGEVVIGSDGLHKAYGRENKYLNAQANFQLKNIITRLRGLGLNPPISHWLILPDFIVQNGASVHWPEGRIVDATSYSNWVNDLRQVLTPLNGNTEVAEKLYSFFSDSLNAQPDVSAIAGRIKEVSTALGGGLATWVPRIEVPSGVVRVQATAGSGKTQLAFWP
jgi:hypothetical protein